MRPLRRVLTQAQDAARSTLVDLTRTRPPARPRPAEEPLRVLITVDTEISLGGALQNPELSPVGVDLRISGELASGRYGIDLFMDLLEAHGMRGVFFFEPMARHLVPPEELANAARRITDRGHDIELHIHPEFRMNLEAVRQGRAPAPPPKLHAFSREEQHAYFTEALDQLEAWTGRRPCTFRAGNYATDDVGIDVCAAQRLAIDSSYNLWAIHAGLCKLPPRPPLNDVCIFPNGILEVPVTNLRPSGPRSGLRPFELSSLNASEMIAAVEQMFEAGSRTCCTTTHSFRLIRTTDVQYETAAPDPFNIHRLKTFVRYLAAHPDRFSVCTYRDLPLDRWRNELSAPPEAPFFPVPPLWSTVSRMTLQAVKDRGVF